MFIDYFKIALRNLRSRQIRSWLTILGIVIGVFLIISMVSLSEGVRNSIEKQLKMVGGDVIMIMPGEFADFMVTMIGGLKLSDDDLEASITPQLVIFGLVFAFLVGSVSGFLPACQAAKLKPLDALRYE